MGFAVAAAARDRGADVTVVAGATTADEPAGVNIIRAVTAEAMHQAVMKELDAASVFIGAAAVADYAPVKSAAIKIKKDSKDTMNLELAKTKDILADVSRSRKEGQIVVGFAAETTDVNEYARSKMEKKGLDIVVANDITVKGAGFNTDTNAGTIIIRDEKDIELPLMPKREMADKILDEIAKLRARSKSK
jgi:phosphopantothenoylcysteine decarboxylase/phosphopantothenate--cysteine ligase